MQRAKQAQLTRLQVESELPVEHTCQHYTAQWPHGMMKLKQRLQCALQGRMAAAACNGLQLSPTPEPKQATVASALALTKLTLAQLECANVTHCCPEEKMSGRIDASMCCTIPCQAEKHDRQHNCMTMGEIRNYWHELRRPSMMFLPCITTAWRCCKPKKMLPGNSGLR